MYCPTRSNKRSADFLEQNQAIPISRMTIARSALIQQYAVFARTLLYESHCALSSFVTVCIINENVALIGKERLGLLHPSQLMFVCVRTVKQVKTYRFAVNLREIFDVIRVVKIMLRAFVLVEALQKRIARPPELAEIIHADAGLFWIVDQAGKKSESIPHANV